MPDPLTPADPGLLASLLDTARLGGFAARNLLMGNPEGAGRNTVDLLGRLVDAPLPGDWIPDVSRKQDRPEFRDVVDLGGDTLATDAVNFLGDVATDPVSYIPGAAVAKGLGAAGKAVNAGVAKLPKGAQDAIAKTGRKVRATFGAQRVSPGTAKALAAKQAAADLVGRAGSEGTVDALQGLSERELVALGEAGQNMRLDPATGRPVSLIDDSQTMTFDQRLQKLLGDDPSLDPERLLAAAPKMRDTLKAQWEAAQAPASSPGGGVFFDRPMAGTPDPVMGGLADIPSQGVRDYFPRQFSGMKADGLDEITGLPKPIAERADWRDSDILKFLQENPEVNLEFNAAKALAQRSSTQGELAGRAQIGQNLFDRARAGEVEVPEDLLAKLLPKARDGYQPVDLLGSSAPNAMAQGGKVASQQADTGAMLAGAKPRPPEAGPAPKLSDYERKQAKDWLLSQDFKLADPDLRSAATAIAKQFPEEEAAVLLNALNGLAPRGAFTGALAKLNAAFKGPAVFGAVIPKLGSITRNLTGGLFQQMANAAARGDVPRAAAALIPNWLKSIDDGIEQLFGARIGKNEFAEVDKAYKLSGGDPRKVSSAIQDPVMRSAVERGVLGNNFINTEGLIKSTSEGGWKAFGKNLYQYPAAMFRGAEQRMRYGLYKSLIKKGASEESAAKTVMDTFFDYSISGVENRAARDVIPFFQFMAKAIPQQAQFLAEKPLAASLLANLQGGGDGGPIYPWMEGKANIPIGQDEQGNQQYLANLGLPVEALNWLPNPSADPMQLGRQVQQNQIGALQPLLKTGVAVATGEDPYFGTPFGSYTKVAGQDLGRPGAVINQLLGTGLPGAAAISGLLGMGAKTTDDRTSLGDKAVNLLTGAKITSVDPDVALRQKLQAHLETNPNVQQYRGFFQSNPDDETQSLLDSLNKAKADIKAKRQAILPVD